MTTISPLPASLYASLVGSSGSGIAVSSGSTPSLSQTAVSLAGEAGVVATLGASPGTSGLTYDAAGLLNSIIQAGTPPQATGSTSTLSAQQSLAPSIANTLSASAPSGSLSTPAAPQASLYDTNANWAAALKTNPQLASTAISDSVAQGIVGSISIFA